MNFYPFHIGDYASATQHLTLEEDAMYRRLLDLQYMSEKPLPKEERQLYRLTRAATESHREAMLTVLREFFDETPEGWISRRAMAEIEVMQEKQQKQKDKAIKRWQSHKQESGNAPALPQHQEEHAAASKTDANAMPPIPIPIPTPIPREEKKTPQPPRGGCLRFEEFWTAWPKSDRKQDKVKCADKWRRQGFDEVADAILADVAGRRTGRKWLDDGGKFIEAPLTYLNGKRWEDGADVEPEQEQFV